MTHKDWLGLNEHCEWLILLNILLLFERISSEMQQSQKMLMYWWAVTHFNVNFPVVRLPRSRKTCRIFFLQCLMDFYDSLQAKDCLIKTVLSEYCLCHGQCKYLNTHTNIHAHTHETRHGSHRGVTLIISSIHCPQLCGTKQDQKPWIRGNWVHLTDARTSKTVRMLRLFWIISLECIYSISPD